LGELLCSYDAKEGVMAMVKRSEAELIKYIENLILANRNNALDEY